MQNVDLDRLDAMRESTTVEPSSANTMWLHEIHNAYPAIAAELRALRADLAEAQRDCECLNQMIRDHQGQSQGPIDAYVYQCEERDQLRAERDALNARTLKWCDELQDEICRLTIQLSAANAEIERLRMMSDKTEQPEPSLR